MTDQVSIGSTIGTIDVSLPDGAILKAEAIVTGLKLEPDMTQLHLALRASVPLAETTAGEGK